MKTWLTLSLSPPVAVPRARIQFTNSCLLLRPLYRYIFSFFFYWRTFRILLRSSSTFSTYCLFYYLVGYIFNKNRWITVYCYSASNLLFSFLVLPNVLCFFFMFYLKLCRTTHDTTIWFSILLSPKGEILYNDHVQVVLY